VFTNPKPAMNSQGPAQSIVVEPISAQRRLKTTAPKEHHGEGIFPVQPAALKRYSRFDGCLS
jgi:hypothetical protein